MSTLPENQVCVVIAAYNSAATIERAVRSALAEPEVSEVIVVDDASTDETSGVAMSCDDGSGRVLVLRQDQNKGPSAARNRAIRMSAAPWFTILDADDFFLPGRIKGLLSYSKEADMVADDLWQVPEHDVSGPRKSLLGGTLIGSRDISLREFVLSNVTEKGTDRKELGFIKPLIRRELLEAHQLRYQEHMRLGEDFELYTRLLAHGARLVLVPAQGYVSVVRAGSLSGNHSEHDLLQLRDCGQAIIKDIPLNATDRQALYRHAVSVDCRLQWRMLIIAVKNRDAKAAAACFMRTHPVAFYLAEKLAEQFCIRVLKRSQ